LIKNVIKLSNVDSENSETESNMQYELGQLMSVHALDHILKERWAKMFDNCYTYWKLKNNHTFAI